MMKILSADMEAMAGEMSQCPPSTVPEFAFIGRSNVGKSSLLNLLTGRKKLAYVSHTPGRTQTLNFFLINQKLRFVDMPGYGYAKVSKVQRGKFTDLVSDYISQRESLRCVFVLIDASIPPQKIDLEFVQWIMGVEMPFVVVFTKTDKASATKVKQNIQDFSDAILEVSVNLPMMFQSSAFKKTGAEEILGLVQQVMAKQ